MLSAWRKWHDSRPALRWLCKLLFVLAVVSVALFPNPLRFATWVQRLQNINTLLDPENPALAPLAEAAQQKIAAGKTPREAVESVVMQAVPYAWDWDVWGVMDYWPTVDEVVQKGREDCDGRAVVAASLLKRLGVEAKLVSDLLHVWVETPQGDLMGPTGGEKTLVGDKQGTKTAISLGLARNAARGFSFGVAVFPWLREVLILAAIILATLHPRARRMRGAIGVALLIGAWLTLRVVGEDAARHESINTVIASGIAISSALLGWILLALRSTSKDRNELLALNHPL